ncbi:hypothetical protein SDC9_112127 [bioreactor metagenome]|uniref:Small, acid-soluble spore protein, alpha/beta type n=1 Tax=bioreactor metagenome TaxID=1076179 RepID=A0A645BIY2_9ZZZZ|nr:small, acid-soluble spore protein, alpha/beta type [Candidatus Metalachnospira sp.]
MKNTKGKEKPLFDLSTFEGRMKFEIAEELGLTEKIKKTGWKSLTSRESGAIGGKLSSKKRAMRKREENI